MSSFSVAKHPPKGRFISPMQQLEGALEEGLGFSKTKSGPGDKETAYVVRQNNCLRLCLIVVFAFSVLAVSFISYLHRYNHIKWDAVSQEVFHRESEHSAQTKLLDTQLELKQSLETLLHQTHRVAEFRSYLERTLGDNGNKLSEELGIQSHLSKDFIDSLISENDIIGTKVIKELDAILLQFDQLNQNAVEELKKVSVDIIENIEEDSTELEMHKKKLKEYGISSKGKLDDFKKNLIKDNKHWQEVISEERASQGNIGKKLEEFFRRVNEMSLPVVSDATVAKWENFLNEAIATINDPQRETDLRSMIGKTNQMMLSDTNDQAPLFDPRADRSIIDYLKIRIYEAKLAPHRDEIMKLYNDWKNKKKRTMQVWKEVESISKEHMDIWLNES